MNEMETTDEALMARFRSSFDQAAFDVLLSRHHVRALLFSQRLLGDRVAAEDAVQDAFIRVVRARQEFDPARSFAGWFHTILRNICTDVQRRRTRRARQVDTLAQQLPASEFVSPQHSSAAVEDLLRPLSPEDREILMLRLVEGLSFLEIADRQGCSLEAAKKRAQRALRLLRERTDVMAGATAKQTEF